MKRMILAVMFVAGAGLLTAAPAQSPLGRLKDKVKEKTAPQTSQPGGNATNPNSNTSNRSAAPNQPAAGSGGAQEPARNPDGTMKTATQSGGDSKYPPGILYSSLVTGAKLQPNGDMTFHNVSATFLPPASSNKGLTPYHWIDGGKLETIIKGAGGNVVHTLRWSAKPTNGPFWLLSSFHPTGNFKMAPGDYVAEFVVEGRPFYRFPFSIVREGGGDDPFAAGAGDKLVLRGPWNDFGYLFLTSGSPSSNLHYKSWFRAPVKKDVKITLDLLRDGKKVAESNPNRSDKLLPMWERLDFELHKPNGGSHFTGSDLLAADGKYKLVVKVDGQHYGNYPFTVQGGKIQHHPRQRRGEVDPMTFIEGGNDAWFVEREK